MNRVCSGLYSLAFLSALFAAVLISGCAKNECYECTRSYPLEDSKKICGKGQDIDVELSWYRSSGYECSKTSSNSVSARPTDASERESEDTSKAE
jgi:hypothetical protein